MNLKDQHVILGLMSLQRYNFNKKTSELTLISTGKTKKIMYIGRKYIYRFALGYSARIDVPVNEFCYLMYYGIYSPLADILHNDGDVFNNLKKNLTATTQKGEIPLDIKDKIYTLFAEGKGYAEIGNILNVDRGTVKLIIKKHFGDVHPHHYKRLKPILSAYSIPNYSKK